MTFSKMDSFVSEKCGVGIIFGEMVRFFLGVIMDR